MDTAAQQAWQLSAAALDRLHAWLTSAGYRVIGPKVAAGAITLGDLESAAELPYGWGVTLAPGGYQLRQRDDRAAFGHSAGPQSWKRFLHPPRELLWSATPDGFTAPAADGDHEEGKLAFLGVRPCDLRAIQIQDEVLGAPRHPGSGYARRRESLFIIAVNCTEPGETCFCVSMGTGPGAGPGYDMLLTELGDQFVVQAGSPHGQQAVADLALEPADPALVERGRAAIEAAAGQMGRTMQADGLRELLAESHDAARWEDVASRCLTCGNCTMACPTCFCTTVEDSTDLSGAHAERWQSWASCFDLDFSVLHSGPVRSSGRSRYKQWLTHKLGTWHDQFGSSGCVGCGRCIVWCPVGIDLTEEVAALRSEAGEAT